MKNKARPMEWIKYDPIRVGLEADSLNLAGRGMYFTLISYLWHSGPMPATELQRRCRDHFQDILDRCVRVGEADPPVYSYAWLEDARAYGSATRQQKVDAGLASIAKRKAAKQETAVRLTDVELPLNDHSMDANDRSTDVERPSFSLSLSLSSSGSESGKNADAEQLYTQPDPPPAGDPPPPPVETPKVEQAPFFEDWWDLYGKKIDRTKCEAKWSRLKQAEREKAMEHTKLYVDATPTIKFRRNPETYLNNKNWNDAYLPSSDTTGTRGATHMDARSKAEAVVKANAEWYRDNDTTAGDKS